MSLPKAEDLAAVLAAIGDAGPKLQAAGVTHVRLGSLELRLAPPAPEIRTPGQEIVDAINGVAPIPADVVRQTAARDLVQSGFTPTIDLQEAIANGARLVDPPGA